MLAAKLEHQVIEGVVAFEVDLTDVFTDQLLWQEDDTPGMCLMIFQDVKIIDEDTGGSIDI